MTPKIGSQVLYLLSGITDLKFDGSRIRPAIVTQVFPNERGPGRHGVNLHVFCDGTNDFCDGRLSHHVYSAECVETIANRGECSLIEAAP